MLNYTIFYNIFLYFWDAIIYAIKAKHEIKKSYSINAKYKLLIIATLSFLLYAELLYFMTYFLFLGCSYLCHKG